MALTSIEYSTNLKRQRERIDTAPFWQFALANASGFKAGSIGLWLPIICTQVGSEHIGSKQTLPSTGKAIAKFALIAAVEFVRVRLD